jgi:chromosome segregation ATPase
VEDFMAIIKQYHKNTNTTYVYESESYWDEEKKQPRSKRRLIGKVDPVTGEIVPTGKRGRKPKADKDHTSQSSPAESSSLLKQHEDDLQKINELKQAIAYRDKEVDTLKRENERLHSSIRKMKDQLIRLSNQCDEYMK